LRIKVKCNIFICNANNICVPSLKENRSVTMPRNECVKNDKKESSVTKRKISKDDAEHNRYPNSKIPGVHKDSAPIGGG